MIKALGGFHLLGCQLSSLERASMVCQRIPHTSDLIAVKKSMPEWPVTSQLKRFYARVSRIANTSNRKTSLFVVLNTAKRD